jgi:hypothetical protein
MSKAWRAFCRRGIGLINGWCFALQNCLGISKLSSCKMLINGYGAVQVPGYPQSPVKSRIPAKSMTSFLTLLSVLVAFVVYFFLALKFCIRSFDGYSTPTLLLFIEFPWHIPFGH